MYINYQIKIHLMKAYIEPYVCVAASITVLYIRLLIPFCFQSHHKDRTRNSINNLSLCKSFIIRNGPIQSGSKQEEFTLT